MDLIYDTEMVSNILGVQSSTIRKYCTLMQKYGYEFNKNSVGHRIFYPKDIAIIKEIVELKNLSSLTLTDAVQAILNSDITDIESISNQSNDKLLKQFEEFKNQQMEFNKKLLEQLEKQDEYIKNSINERDQKLLAAIKESMETRKQIAEEAKKSKWKFWKR